MNKYNLIIEEHACWGCQTCEVACKQEFNPIENKEGVKYISVWPDGPKLVDGKLDFVWRVTVCKHCEDPECLHACPVGVITKRGDGIVVLDQSKCIGCEACIPACPYDAITIDKNSRTAIKCNLCHHRVDKGLYPACADNVCLAHCIYFGDPAEIEAQIAEKRKTRAC
jgi:Fe-S-cluster-containing dehydrogenase component